MTQACLGGWCRLRENCPHYHAQDRREPAERLCDKGADGESSAHYLQFVRPTQFDHTPMEEAA